VQETLLPFEQVAVAVQLGQAGQLIVPVSVPVQYPRWPEAQLESTALEEVPVQVTVEPSQQWAVESDLVGRRCPRAATSWAWGWASTAGAGAKIADQAAAEESGEAARTGREQNARIRSAAPRIRHLFISYPP
jgi:hypothetical protein